jgi:acyl-[acyl carrier protein]--UDP-N-acetylglucosamine O-acyltransferase
MAASIHPTAIIEPGAELGADVQIGALGQSVGGEIAVQSDHVEVKVYLPVLLSGLADRIGLFIRARGEESLQIEGSKKS